ncbi:hypothetical protein Gpo141_00008241 [Globisporangium polare]
MVFKSCRCSSTNEYNTLEPYVDTLTMSTHHSMEHEVCAQFTSEYVEKCQRGELKGKSIVEVVQNAKADLVRNNANGHHNHRPVGKAQVQDRGLVRGRMKETFAKTAAERFGSGWVGLGGKKDGKLAITSTMNQDNPLMPNVQEPMIPILDLDGWEHAYSLQYQNRRTEYIRGVLERGQLGPGRALLRGVCRQAKARVARDGGPRGAIDQPQASSRKVVRSQRVE